ncbi:MAG: IclR family transcriptional regulator [Azospirillum sp.]|jgi:DNA-binding IclR family transcriptional regulator|nr:IclR family transcriptional regulator [Azospirillum sp.]MCZ8123572.1 IclR family transcriptional regulator [Magnetospirillum sp.]
MTETLDVPARTNRDKDGVAAVGRALALVAAFDERNPRLTLAELAKRTGFYKSTILRLSVSLERAGFLARDPDGAFRVGAAALKAGQLYQAAFRLGDVALPILRKLAADTGETASLYVREGDMRVCLHRVESAQMVRAIVREGDRRPLDRGAAGKVLRLDQAASELAENGFLVSIGEVSAESAAIAAPVYGADARIVAAISASGPAQRFTPVAIPAMGAHAKAAAAELTTRLGGRLPV